MQMTQQMNWPIFDLKFVKKLTVDSISCTFENQKWRLTTASEQCFCLIRCKKGSGSRLSVGEHLSIVYYLLYSPLDMMSDAGKYWT